MSERLDYPCSHCGAICSFGEAAQLAPEAVASGNLPSHAATVVHAGTPCEQFQRSMVDDLKAAFLRRQEKRRREKRRLKGAHPPRQESGRQDFPCPHCGAVVSFGDAGDLAPESVASGVLPAYAAIFVHSGKPCEKFPEGLHEALEEADRKRHAQPFLTALRDLVARFPDLPPRDRISLLFLAAANVAVESGIEPYEVVDLFLKTLKYQCENGGDPRLYHFVTGLADAVERPPAKC